MQSSSAGLISTPNMGAWRAQMERGAFRGLDADANGAIGLEEFKAGLQNLPAGRSGPAGSAGSAGASVEEVFRSIDRDGDGQLSAAEVKAAMQGRADRQRGSATEEEREARGLLGGIGNFLVAQFFGQDQAGTPASVAAASAGQAAGAEVTEQARRLLLRYAATQTTGRAAAGAAAA